MAMSSGGGRGRGGSLSKASAFEQKFGVRHRGVGRPAGMSRDDVLFPRTGGDPEAMCRIAIRRAYAVVHEENRDRLTALYRAELAVLRRRGLEQVLSDAGVVGLGVNGEEVSASEASAV